MAEKFQNKYRIASARLQNWDYSWDALYYVTICTQNQEFYFGDIAKGVMRLSAIGKLAQKYWYEIPLRYPFVELEEFVVMPNHIHAILIINNPNNRSDEIFGPDGRDAIHRVCEDGKDMIYPHNGDAINRDCTGRGGITGYKNPMLWDGLPRIIRWYKGRVSFESRKIHADFAWHTRFWDHIIRNDKVFLRIKEYIHDNSANWKAGKFRNQGRS